jgi:hypothetical protein
MRTSKSKEKKCKYCAKAFKPYNGLQQFCSYNCANEHQRHNKKRTWTPERREARKGANNPNFRNGQYIREDKWQQPIRKQTTGERQFVRNAKEIEAEMIERVGYKYCQYCTASNSPRFERHHIIYRSEKPNHPSLHSKVNILIVCIACHNEFHKHKILRNGLVKKRGLDKLFGADVLKTKPLPSLAELLNSIDETLKNKYNECTR